MLCNHYIILSFKTNMSLKYKILIIIFLYLIGCQKPIVPVNTVVTNDELDYIIKSMSWKKINRILKSSDVKTEKEAFALIRYHESSTEGDEEDRFHLLYWVVSGQKVSQIGSSEIANLQNKTIQQTSAIYKICFYKLYHELVNRKMLNETEKMSFLQKMPRDEDPTIVKIFEDLVLIPLDNEKYETVQSMIESLSASEKRYLYTAKIMRRLAYSKFKLGKKDEARELYVQLLGSKKLTQPIKNVIIKDYSEFLGTNPLSKMNKEELSLLASHFSKKDQQSIVKKGYISPNSQFSSSKMVRGAGILFAKFSPESVSKLINKNRSIIGSDDRALADIIEVLFYQKEYKIVEKLLDTHLKESKNDKVMQMYIRLYRKNKSDNKYYYSILNYLSNYPYDLRIHDLLIDFLISHNSSKIKFAKKEYWEYAIQTIPNLPIKGRLVYWYFRYLKKSGQNDKLLSMLNGFYKLSPGSYYINVIKEEFASEIKSIPVPNNPFIDKDTLFKFLSLKKQNEFVVELKDKDLSFAYYKDSLELGNRLISALIRYESHPTTKLIVEYLKIGEFSTVEPFMHRFAEEQNLSAKEKNEYFVGLGDVSKDTYLSLFHTRTLMKIQQIPDDPLLLPATIHLRLYPRPHRELVQKNTSQFNVEEDIVYAIMRQESFFRESALSPANAKGLMQVIPSTGRILAKSLKVIKYSLHDPEVSIQFGTKFLSDLLKSNSGNLRWASIAYNGGPGNLRKWKRNHYRDDFNHFLEELPSKESRDYCRIVVSNYNNYYVLRMVNKL